MPPLTPLPPTSMPNPRRCGPPLVLGSAAGESVAVMSAPHRGRQVRRAPHISSSEMLMAWLLAQPVSDWGHPRQWDCVAMDP